MAAPTPFRKGKAVLERKSGAGAFLSVGQDEAVQFAPMVGMDDMISADVHEFWEVNPAVFVVCLGSHCPACATGNKPKFKAYLPVLTQEGEAKIFAFGITVARQLTDLEAELGNVRGSILKVKRTGAGMKTKYTVIPLGKKVKVDGREQPDIESRLGPTTVDGIRKAMADGGLLDDADVEMSGFVESDEEEAPAPKAAAKEERKPRAKRVEKEVAAEKPAPPVDETPWEDEEPAVEDEGWEEV